MATLFKTLPELQQHVTVSNALSLPTLTPFLQNSEAEKEVIRVTGQAIYSDLLIAYNANSMSAAQLAILPFVQKPLANLALHAYIQQSGVLISTAGLTTDREKQPYQYQQIKLEQSILNTAYFSLDALIAHLFAHQDDFADWKNTSEYASNRNHFINTPGEFTKWVNIKNNYRTLIALRPFITQVEESVLKATLGKALYDEVKGQILTTGEAAEGSYTFYIDQNGNLIQEGTGGQVFNINQDGQLYVTYLNLTPEVATLLTDYIQPVLAHLVIARAVQELNFNITADGAFLHGIKASSSANIKEVVGPDMAQKTAYAALHEKDGNAWLSQMTDYLNANASETVYPQYFASTLYQTPDAADANWDLEDDGKIYY